MGKQY